MVFVETLLGMNRDFFAFWGYFFVFLFLFIESIPFLGAFIPGGTILLLISGILCKLGFFSLWKIITIAFLSSVVIDIISYALGRRAGKDFLYKYSKILLIKKETLEKIGHITYGHPGKSLIIGRLNPVTRSIAPFIVGTEKVKFWKFLFWNFIGGFLWVTLFIFLGYMFGGSLQVMKETERYIINGTILIAGGFYTYYIVSFLRQRSGGNKCTLEKNGINCKK